MNLGALAIQDRQAKTIEQQTGWKRPHPEMICQDHEVLLRVHDYSYDLGNEDFTRYFISRTGIQIGKEEKPELARWLLTSPKAERWLLESPDYKYLNGEMVPFGQEREIDIKISRILKGRLQDCWELFLKTEGGTYL